MPGVMWRWIPGRAGDARWTMLRHATATEAAHAQSIPPSPFAHARGMRPIDDEMHWSPCASTIDPRFHEPGRDPFCTCEATA